MNNLGCACCGEIFIFDCQICGMTHGYNKYKFCNECDECSGDSFHEYCPEHDIKYEITSNFYNMRMCEDCIIDPNKKTRYCLECKIRHNIIKTEFCEYCNNCLIRNNNIYKHCAHCSTCYLYIDEDGNEHCCEQCISLVQFNVDDFFDMMRYQHSLVRTNSAISNETEYSQLNLSDLDFDSDESEEI